MNGLIETNTKMVAQSRQGKVVSYGAIEPSLGGYKRKVAPRLFSIFTHAHYEGLPGQVEYLMMIRMKARQFFLASMSCLTYRIQLYLHSLLCCTLIQTLAISVLLY